MSPVRLIFSFGLIAVVSADIDCRQFTFAPQCRGIILKRSSAPEQFDMSTKTRSTPADILARLLEDAELAGYTVATDVAFVRSYLDKKRTEEVAQELP